VRAPFDEGEETLVLYSLRLVLLAVNGPVIAMKSSGEPTFVIGRVMLRSKTRWEDTLGSFTIIMSRRASHVVIVRAAAVLQGLALVVVPTVSAVLTDTKGLALSPAAYGTLFVPQSIGAVICSFGGAIVTRRFGVRVTLLTGFTATAIAMALMSASAVLGADHAAAYAVLLCATSALGIGFALVTPTLNVLAGTLEPDNRDRAVLVVNALLGGSAAVAPLFLIVFVGLGCWWGLPSVCAVGLLALIALTARTSFDRGNRDAAHASFRLPVRVLLFGAFAFVYGLCEQLNASWAPIYMTQHLGASLAEGSIALALFWAIATAARVAFAVFGRIFASSSGLSHAADRLGRRICAPRRHSRPRCSGARHCNVRAGRLGCVGASSSGAQLL